MPRILVDQSGYDLLNHGDVAMLQSCVARLATSLAGWGDYGHRSRRGPPRILVVQAPLPLDRETLASPAIGPFPTQEAPASFGTSMENGSAQLLGSPRRKAYGTIFGPFAAIQAVRSADLVVASGGAYVTDT